MEELRSIGARMSAGRDGRTMKEVEVSPNAPADVCAHFPVRAVAASPAAAAGAEQSTHASSTQHPHPRLSSEPPRAASLVRAACPAGARSKSPRPSLPDERAVVVPAAPPPRAPTRRFLQGSARDGAPQVPRPPPRPAHLGGGTMSTNTPRPAICIMHALCALPAPFAALRVPPRPACCGLRVRLVLRSPCAVANCCATLLPA